MEALFLLVIAIVCVPIWVWILVSWVLFCTGPKDEEQSAEDLELQAQIIEGQMLLADIKAKIRKFFTPRT